MFTNYIGGLIFILGYAVILRDKTVLQSDANNIIYLDNIFLLLLGHCHRID